MSDEVFENDSVTASEEAVIHIVDELGEAQRERDEYLNTLQHLQADFENYRKRVAKSSVETAARAQGDMVAKLLPVLDAFDYAMAHFDSSGSEESAALSQARGLLIDTLAMEGLERIDVVGVAFDPQVHDAVAHIAAEVDGEQVIDEILRAGYRWKGAVLRPAMVRVMG